MKPLKNLNDKKVGDYLIIPFSNFREQGSAKKNNIKILI